MTYRAEIIKAMSMLGAEPQCIFLGQSVRYSGHAMFGTLEEARVSPGKRIEMPVTEEMQMGISTGLALQGFIPVSIYPRFDFVLCAANQLVNHLDKMEEMTQGQFKPKVIIRTMVGSKTPLHPGPQHCQDYTDAFSRMLTNIEIVKLATPSMVLRAYINALKSDYSTILVEMGDLY